MPSCILHESLYLSQSQNHARTEANTTTLIEAHFDYHAIAVTEPQLLHLILSERLQQRWGNTLLCTYVNAQRRQSNAFQVVTVDSLQYTVNELITCWFSCACKLILHLTSQKYPISPPRKSKKTNLSINLLSLRLYGPGPQILTHRPQILRGIRI